MKTFLTFTFSLIFTFYAQAQIFPSEIWHPGEAVLITGDTLEGLIKYDLEKDAIQLKLASDKVQAYSAQKLFYFKLYDAGIKGYRHFYSLPLQVNRHYSVPMLFEVLYEGRLTLLAREKIVQAENMEKVTDLSLLPNDTRLLLAFDFFFLEKDGTIRSYEPKRRRLLSIMDRKYKEVKKYIRRNKLRHDEMSDLVRITAYYNALGE
ncbi:hypothetical protein [Nafulsella turpanensis]|uniref:hypothetical protein n=1 Tax=Nafulsella turpanensis TaxID=1265690 RepID=UPI000346F69A|nr:hypothetical protein [Nafulsella turpanensis]